MKTIYVSLQVTKMCTVVCLKVRYNSYCKGIYGSQLEIKDKTDDLARPTFSRVSKFLYIDLWKQTDH